MIILKGNEDDEINDFLNHLINYLVTISIVFDFLVLHREQKDVNDNLWRLMKKGKYFIT